jgi:hypothetical protein
MEKLPGVESATVKLNEGWAVLQLRPDNRVTIAEVRERVRRNGFTPREAVVTARADVVLEADRVRLRISGTDEIYDLRTTSESLEQRLRSGAGQTFVVTGTIPFEKEPSRTPVLQVTDAKPVTR